MKCKFNKKFLDFGALKQYELLLEILFRCSLSTKIFISLLKIIDNSNSIDAIAF